MNILLVCSGGMSSSILERNIQNIAEDRGLVINVLAVGVNYALTILEQYNVVLVAPQVRFMLPQIKEVADKVHVPVELIDMKDYGLMNGDHVLDQAIKIINENGTNQ